MYKFANRTGCKGLQLSAGAKSARIVVSPTLPGPLTIATAEPLQGPGKHAFEVAMPKKGVRTAVGFTESPAEEYMTPDYRRDRGYISMGGAGFIYPAKAMSRATYGEGDTVGRTPICRVAYPWLAAATCSNGAA